MEDKRCVLEEGERKEMKERNAKKIYSNEITSQSGRRLAPFVPLA